MMRLEDSFVCWIHLLSSQTLTIFQKFRRCYIVVSHIARRPSCSTSVSENLVIYFSVGFHDHNLCLEWLGGSYWFLFLVKDMQLYSLKTHINAPTLAAWLLLQLIRYFSLSSLGLRLCIPDFQLQTCRLFSEPESTIAMSILLEMLVWTSQKCWLHSDQYLRTLMHTNHLFQAYPACLYLADREKHDELGAEWTLWLAR